mgnify:FL=1
MLKIENLTKTYNYKKSNAFTALKDVSLEVEDGEMLAIIGKSGAGKSTLLHIIGCIDKFEKGSYIIDGTDVHSLSDNKLAKIRNEKVGIVMQDFALIDEYSVIENVMIPLNFSKKKLGKPKELAMKALERVGIANLAKKPVSKLSGGQKQRVAIARAIVNDPSFILADEPTGALDTKTSSEIMELFTELNKSGKTFIIITHDLTVADKCKRKVEICDGRII